MNSSERRLAAEFPRFNYQDALKTAIREPNDPPGLLTFNAGFLQAGGSFDNASKFKITLVDVDPNDHSKLQVNLIPYLEGEYEVHVFIGNHEIAGSPVAVRVIKSEEQRRLEALEKIEEERLQRLREERNRDRLKKLEEQMRKKKAAEEEKLRQQRLKEEELQRRREETEKRAQEIMKRAKEAKEAELRAKEEERKY